ncbi:hypothetical protein Goari_001064 [Gossypium aridum]|uniref:RNase H type-1 domain-containing protein n=1 Tax=Gossypium aridum TaxID=34290 RepID=A0A7J8YIM5_GOSAI|nr:hypothetical protein [Gossypium aridum]
MGVAIRSKQIEAQTRNVEVGKRALRNLVTLDLTEIAVEDADSFVKPSFLHFNPTFEGPIETLGCASSKFLWVFREYNQKHKSDLIGLLETRVNGEKTDSIIAKLGFQCSHRVEAIRFSTDKVINKIVGVPSPHPFFSLDRIIWGLLRLALSLSKALIRGFKKLGVYEASSFQKKGFLDSTLDTSLTGYLIATCSSFKAFPGVLMKSSKLHIAGQDNILQIEEGFAATTGLVHDHNGGWIIGFCRYLGNYSLKAVNAIQEGFSGNSNSALIRRIHQILKMVKQWKFQRILREENTTANSLIKMLRNIRLGLRLFDDPPLEN